MQNAHIASCRGTDFEYDPNCGTYLEGGPAIVWKCLKGRSIEQWILMSAILYPRFTHRWSYLRFCGSESTRTDGISHHFTITGTVMRKPLDSLIQTDLGFVGLNCWTNLLDKFTCGCFWWFTLNWSMCLVHALCFSRCFYDFLCIQQWKPIMYHIFSIYFPLFSI